MSDSDLEYLHIATKEKGRFSTFVILKGTNGDGANIAYCTLVGEHGWWVQTLTDEQLIEEVHNVLRTALPDLDSEILRPVKVHLHRWGNDEYFKGTFSMRKTGAFLDGNSSFSDLQAPVGRLHFAGEGFHHRYHAYLQGAYCSGEKCAENILNLINEN